MHWILMGSSGREHRPAHGGVLRYYNQCDKDPSVFVKTIANTWFLANHGGNVHNYEFRYAFPKRSVWLYFTCMMHRSRIFQAMGHVHIEWCHTCSPDTDWSSSTACLSHLGKQCGIRSCISAGACNPKVCFICCLADSNQP